MRSCELGMMLSRLVVLDEWRLVPTDSRYSVSVKGSQRKWLPLRTAHR
jgi:hypothetical protein